jgi:hypothetical protein
MSKAIEIQAPNKVEVPDMYYSIFLAGSIEMGKAELWQEKVVKELEDLPVVLVNPRRDDWDSSWEQTKDNPKFKEQVDWELDNLNDATFIILYLDPNTMSPISLIELGLYIGYDIFVCCPKGFWKKGNVDIVCERFEIPLFESLDELIGAIKSTIHNETVHNN